MDDRADLNIGSNGSGTLNIQAGGQVSSGTSILGEEAGSNGTATVTGTGSKWTNTGGLNVGFRGSGTLSIEGGGQVSNSSGYVGYGVGNASATGTATVAGSGLTWTNSGCLYVGYSGGGTLNIQAGGQVSSVSCYVGYSGSGAATVTDAGSNWTNSGDLYVRKGTLNVQAGGQVQCSSGNSYVGNSGSTGTATVTGAGSTWINSGDLWVGNSGSGKLTVADGGKVTAATLYAGGSDLLGNGTIAATRVR